MCRKTLCYLSVLIVLIVSGNIYAQQQGISEDNLIGRIYYSDLFVIGKVLSVHSMTVNGWYDFTPNEYGANVVTKIDVEINEMIVGEYSGSTIVFYLTIGETESLKTEDGEGVSSIGIKPGDIIATPIRLSNTYNANIVLPENTGVFKVIDDRFYSYYHQCDIGLDKPIETLREAAKSASINNIVRDADLICLVELKKGMPNDERLTSYDILSIIKGDYTKGVISIDYSSSQPIPRSLNKEERLLLFLIQRSADQYDYIIKGRSIYIVDGKFIRTVRGMPMITGIDDIINMVEEGE